MISNSDYFLQSEQLPTKVFFAHSSETLVGLMIQRLPEQSGTDDKPHHAPPEQNIEQNIDQSHAVGDAFEEIAILASTVTAKELLELAPTSLLHRLFSEKEIALFDPKPVKFACSCSRERTRQALITLPPDELQALIDRDETTKVTCEFCDQIYVYDKVDLVAIERSSESNVIDNTQQNDPNNLH